MLRSKEASDVLLVHEVPRGRAASSRRSSGRGSSGLENIPKTGGVILASNHLSFIDSVFLPLVIDRRMSFLAKSDYFTGKGLKGWATRTFSRHRAAADRPLGRQGVGGIPQHRAQVLGTRRPARHLPRGHAQPRRQAVPRPHRRRAHGARGARSRRPRRDGRHREGHADRRKMPKVRRIGIIFGEPLDFSRFEGMEGDRFILRSVTDEIMVRAAAASAGRSTWTSTRRPSRKRSARAAA